jgi:hypothetical protein
MNRQNPSQELMKKKKQRNIENNNDKLSHAWPWDSQQKWIQTFYAKPSPLLPRTHGLPSLSCPYHMAWPTNKHVEKKMTSLSPLKEQQELSPSSFCFR